MKQYNIKNIDDLIIEFGFLIEEALEILNLDDISVAFDVAWKEAEEELEKIVADLENQEVDK